MLAKGLKLSEWGKGKIQDDMKYLMAFEGDIVADNTDVTVDTS